MHGKAIWKPGIGEIAKVARGIALKSHKKGGYSTPYEPSAANMLSFDIKLNPSWKTEVSKIAWIRRPCSQIK